jgi:hypothetical protein
VRWLVLLLMLANLGFLALAEGWLAPLLVLSTAQQREPGRLSAQVAPERVRIVAAGAAAASAAAALVPAAAPPASAADAPTRAAGAAGVTGAGAAAPGAADVAGAASAGPR